MSMILIEIPDLTLTIFVYLSIGTHTWGESMKIQKLKNKDHPNMRRRGTPC